VALKTVDRGLVKGGEVAAWLEDSKRERVFWKNDVVDAEGIGVLARLEGGGKLELRDGGGEV